MRAPQPLCSLTGSHYNVRRYRTEYHDPLIAEFARHFGQPGFRITVAPEKRIIAAVEVVRDAVCGCARHMARGLLGVSVDNAGFEAGMLHHHYPRLAGMVRDPDFNDTLMHVSGHII